MSGAAIVVAALLALAVLLGWVRLVLWRRGAPERGSRMRFASLLVAQPVLAGLLYLTLFPPAIGAAEDPVLTVATAGAVAPGATDVALPEAAGLAAAAHAPDLATALRRHPGVRRVRVLGSGLEPRDREAARDVAIDFAPGTLPKGLIALTPPARVAPGATFQVGGAAAGVGKVELLDPAGAVVDQATPGADGGFALTGVARVPGVALFRLRLDGKAGAAVPVVVAAEAPVRVLYLAGAPGPEVKYWRRWAADAGLAARVGMNAGAGIELGDAMPPIGAGTLAETDLLIVDDRRWETLGGAARAAVAQAVRGGMGVMFRVTGPLSAATRNGWAEIGAPVAAVRGERPVRLAGAALPVLTRWDALASDGIPLARDAAGAPFAAWRAVRRGRAGLWTLGDGFALVTTGHAAQFGALWAATVTTLARPRAQTTPAVLDWPVAGERTTLCGVDASARVTAPDGGTTRLFADRDGCAGYWARIPGWHVLGSRSASMPFHVFEASEISDLRAAERRAATLALAGRPVPTAAAAVRTMPGSSWPWLLALLTAASLLWWRERRPRGGRRDDDRFRTSAETDRMGG